MSCGLEYGFEEFLEELFEEVLGTLGVRIVPAVVCCFPHGYQPSAAPAPLEMPNRVEKIISYSFHNLYSIKCKKETTR